MCARRTGECSKNPEYMIHNCKMSCGYCSPICTDTNSRCTEWAKADKVARSRSMQTLTAALALSLARASSAWRRMQHDTPLADTELNPNRASPFAVPPRSRVHDARLPRLVRHVLLHVRRQVRRRRA